MREEPQVVRVVADELGDHPPLWFPPPIFDDEARMPVSPQLIHEFRQWNKVQNVSVGATAEISEHSTAEISEHYRVGRALAKKLAQELGSSYSVQMLMAGDQTGWIQIEP